MEIKDMLPIWNKLTDEQKNLLERTSSKRKIEKGNLLSSKINKCIGLVIIETGQLRAFIVSETGREITLCRLFERDIYLLTASCVLSGIQFEVNLEAEKDTEYWVIPPDVFQQLMEESVPVSNYTNKLMASLLSEVMWLIDNVMFKSFDSRLAEFLLEESANEGGNVLDITHEKIANHLGSAREVVTRMLKYFQSEGIVKLSRGKIEITDIKKMKEISK